MSSQLNGVRVPGRKVVLGVRPEVGAPHRSPDARTPFRPWSTTSKSWAPRASIHADANGSRIIALDTGTGELLTGTPVHLRLGGDARCTLFSRRRRPPHLALSAH